MLAADPKGEGATTISAGVALIRERTSLRRSSAPSTSFAPTGYRCDSALADLTQDENTLRIAVKCSARIAMLSPAPGGVIGLAGDIIKLTYVRNRGAAARRFGRHFVAAACGRKRRCGKNIIAPTLARSCARRHDRDALTAPDQLSWICRRRRAKPRNRSNRHRSLLGRRTGGLKRPSSPTTSSTARTAERPRTACGDIARAGHPLANGSRHSRSPIFRNVALEMARRRRRRQTSFIGSRQARSN